MRILVFPAASSPSINILMSFLPKIFASILPILARWGWGRGVLSEGGKEEGSE